MLPTSDVFISHGFGSHQKSAKDRMRQLTDDLLSAQRKLVLVLDIDHTLLHTTKNPHAAEAFKRKDVSEDIFVINLVATSNNSDAAYYVKLRPNLKQFLDSLKNDYFFVIYTKGLRIYAERILTIIDPDNSLVQQRIVSREDQANINDLKTIKTLFPCAENSVLVIDDRVNIWQTKRNVFQCHKFHFWPADHATTDDPDPILDEYIRHQNEILSLGEKPLDDKFSIDLLEARNKDNILDTMKNVLKAIHILFFTTPKMASYPNSDAPELLALLRKTILSGIHIVFSGIYPIDAISEDQHVWRLASELGAICSETITPRTTHLVAVKCNTEKASQAASLKDVTIVSVAWLFSCAAHFKRVSEKRYILDAKSRTAEVFVRPFHKKVVSVKSLLKSFKKNHTKLKTSANLTKTQKKGLKEHSKQFAQSEKTQPAKYKSENPKNKEKNRKNRSNLKQSEPFRNKTEIKEGKSKNAAKSKHSKQTKTDSKNGPLEKQSSILKTASQNCKLSRPKDPRLIIKQTNKNETNIAKMKSESHFQNKSSPKPLNSNTFQTPTNYFHPFRPPIDPLDSHRNRSPFLRTEPFFENNFTQINSDAMASFRIKYCNANDPRFSRTHVPPSNFYKELLVPRLESKRNPFPNPRLFWPRISRERRFPAMPSTLNYSNVETLKSENKCEMKREHYRKEMASKKEQLIGVKNRGANKKPSLNERKENDRSHSDLYPNPSRNKFNPMATLRGFTPRILSPFDSNNSLGRPPVYLPEMLGKWQQFQSGNKALMSEQFPYMATSRAVFSKRRGNAKSFSKKPQKKGVNRNAKGGVKTKGKKEKKKHKSTGMFDDLLSEHLSDLKMDSSKSNSSQKNNTQTSKAINSNATEKVVLENNQSVDNTKEKKGGNTVSSLEEGELLADF